MSLCPPSWQVQSLGCPLRQPGSLWSVALISPKSGDPSGRPGEGGRVRKGAETGRGRPSPPVPLAETARKRQTEKQYLLFSRVIQRTSNLFLCLWRENSSEGRASRAEPLSFFLLGAGLFQESHKARLFNAWWRRPTHLPPPPWLFLKGLIVPVAPPQNLGTASLVQEQERLAGHAECKSRARP